MKSVARSHRIAIAQYTSDGCSPIIGAESAFCRSINHFVIGRVADLKPDVVVLAASWNSSDLDRVRRTIALLEESSVSTVLVVGPVPAWRPTLPKALSQSMQQHPLGPLPTRMHYGLDTDQFELDAQLKKRLTNSGRCANSGWSTLTATCRPMSSWTPSNTAPMPPSPILRKIS